MFDVLFGAGLDKTRYPALQEAAGETTALVANVAAQLAPDGDPELAWQLVLAIASVAHGHAVLLLDGGFANHAAVTEATSQVDPVAAAEQRAAAATRALLRGRGLLFESP